MRDYIEFPVLYPMGPYTFAVACQHCANYRSDKCHLCKCERKSGFEPKRNPKNEEAEHWAKERLVKTQQSEFLDRYPAARIVDGVLNICPRDVYTNTSIRCTNDRMCRECKRSFWLAKAPVDAEAGDED